MLPERTVRKPFGQQAEDHEGAEERHDVGVGETESWHAFSLNDRGACEREEGVLSQTTVVAQSLDVQETSVGFKADLPESGKMNEPLGNSKVEGIVGGELGAKAPALLVVLLHRRALVIDMKGGDDARGDDTGTETTWGGTDDPAAEDELNVVRTAEVEVLADHLLEEDPAGLGSIEDLGEGKLGLEDGELIAIACAATCGRRRRSSPARGRRRSPGAAGGRRRTAPHCPTPGNGSPPSSAGVSRTRVHSGRTWRCRGSTRRT